jgi:hypothetical protein
VRRRLAIPFLALALWLLPAPAPADAAGAAPVKKVEMKAEKAAKHSSEATPGTATKAKKNGPKAEMKAKKAAKKHASNVAPDPM